MSLWNFVFAALMVKGVSASDPDQVEKGLPADPEEAFIYQCARGVSTMVELNQQQGPVFAVGDLVFTSVEDLNSRRLLILNSGSGIFTVPLARSGVNRLRFRLPGSQQATSKEFFISYSHGGRLRSRYFEFATTEPPPGHDQMDYDHVAPKRSRELVRHFEHAIFETTENHLSLISEGRIDRQNWSRRKVEGCENLVKKNTGLADQLRRNLDVFEMIVLGPVPKKIPDRLPASVFFKEN